MAKSSPRASESKPRPRKGPESEAPAHAGKHLHQIAATLGFLVLQASPHKEAKNPDKIRFLSKFGFDRYQIAAIIDSTPGTVSKEQSVLRASKEKEEEAAE